MKQFTSYRQSEEKLLAKFQTLQPYLGSSFNPCSANRPQLPDLKYRDNIPLGVGLWKNGKNIIANDYDVAVAA